MQPIQATPQPGLWKLFGIWASIGLQSFGGGASTSFMIQREFAIKRSWITLEEYTHYWNLCVFAPGINLIAITILIGRKLGGTWGIVLSLFGMLFPSALVTCLLTALFTHIEQFSATQSILRGVLPATAGIMLLVGIRQAQPQLKIAHQEGIPSLLITILLILISALAIILFQAPVILVIPILATLGIIFFTRRKKSHELLQEEGKTDD